jgi:hypothetical protein
MVLLTWNDQNYHQSFIAATDDFIFWNSIYNVQERVSLMLFEPLKNRGKAL